MGWRSYPLIDEEREPNAFAPPAPRADAGAPAGGGRVGYGWDNGEKFLGGWGSDTIWTADYWTLRARSSELFERNLYARGLIRTLVTNEITTGLHLECMPEERILGLEEEDLNDWTEDVENRFKLWGNDPVLCDQSEQMTFGQVQAAARQEALVAGDVLVVLRSYQPTGLPRVQLIGGSAVQSPLETQRAGNEIKHGVEIDALGRQVAYWVRQKDGTSKRLPAWGEKSGRKLAWLVYGTDKRLDDVRGKPLLSLVLQSLKEVDRYRDATLRKAVINSMLAMFIKKEQAVAGSRPLTAGGGAVRVGATSAANDGGDLQARSFVAAEMIPGVAMQELMPGEEPHVFAPNSGDVSFGVFEEAIITAIAWSFEVPPEILRKSFSSNYSASKAAISEFDIYLEKVRAWFGSAFCQPIFVDWLVSQSLAKKIQRSAQIVEAWRDISKHDLFGAWTSSDWSGQVKPSLDPYKMTKAHESALSMGLTTHDRAAREFNGSKFSKNVKRLKRENELLAAALEPLAALERPAAPPDPHGLNEDDGDHPTNKDGGPGKPEPEESDS